MANIIQNISKKRADKKITKADFQYIMALSWLSAFPGTTAFASNSIHPLGYVPAINLYYVKGVENGKATCVWRLWVTHEFLSHTSPTADLYYSTGTSALSYSIVKWGTNSSPDSIYKSLKINEGEVKIILETLFLSYASWKNMNNQTSIKGKLKLYLLSPLLHGSSRSFHGCCNSVVIFTPKPGLFDETGPQ